MLRAAGGASSVLVGIYVADLASHGFNIGAGDGHLFVSVESSAPLPAACSQASLDAGWPSTGSRSKACGLPDAVTVGDLADHMLMIMAQDFMDPWTFNQENLMKCCKEFLLPGGQQIPFCAYNTIGYREQARAQLEAMEPARRRARAEGRRFEPTPVTFSFGELRA